MSARLAVPDVPSSAYAYEEHKDRARSPYDSSLRYVCRQDSAKYNCNREMDHSRPLESASRHHRSAWLLLQRHRNFDLLRLRHMEDVFH
jgi:hypothetical protein